MRPLARGPSRKKYATYSSYRADLLKAYGNYCAYCERSGRDLDIEHVEPKSYAPLKKTSWSNLLLACPTCNRDFKKAWNHNRRGYTFPDMNDTLRVFHYRKNGTIGAVTKAAMATRKLCGLDRPACNGDRADAIYLALKALPEVLAGTRRPEELIDWIKSVGYWSVWVSVYYNVPVIMSLLCDPAHFPGTRPNLFHPRNRPKIK